MGQRVAERAYNLAEAAAIKSVSVDTLREAIKSTGQPDKKTGKVMPPLLAKKVGREYRVTASALDDWFDRLDDA